jgi:hypothetical protein
LTSNSNSTNKLKSTIVSKAKKLCIKVPMQISLFSPLNLSSCFYLLEYTNNSYIHTLYHLSIYNHSLKISFVSSSLTHELFRSIFLNSIYFEIMQVSFSIAFGDFFFWQVRVLLFYPGCPQSCSLK